MLKVKGAPLLVILFLPSALCADALIPSTPFGTAHDSPLHAQEKILQKTDAYTQLRVEFDGISPHSRVPAFLYIPNDGKPKHPAVLSQYGSGGSKKTDYIVAIDQQAVAKGFVVLTIDIPDKGERKPKDK